MAKFKVRRPELHWCVVEVEAESFDEAFALAVNDEGTEVKLEYDQTFEPDEHSWLVSDPDGRDRWFDESPGSEEDPSE